jgi:penicillin-binding protein 2
VGECDDETGYGAVLRHHFCAGRHDVSGLFHFPGVYLAQAAGSQSSYLLDVASSRGIIYDCNMLPLTDGQRHWVAAVMPGPEASAALLDAVPDEDRDSVIRKLEAMNPFVCRVLTSNLYAKGIDVFEARQRYDDDQLAAHIVGLVDPATGKGASGIELACEDTLSAAGGSVRIRYQVDAARRALTGAAPELMDSGYQSEAGVVLTVDSRIQRIAERAAQSIRKGAVVVMDPYTGDIKASVSRPSYNPNNLAVDLQNEDSPFINRAFYAYSVGSAFKLLVAATALEQGVSVGYTFNCEGNIRVGDQLFNCHNTAGHGVMDMRTALQKSCNPYFINLILKIGAQSVAYKASAIGLGRATQFAENYRTQSGRLPGSAELRAPAAAANFGFGQGSLTATPVQMAALVSAIAGSGMAVQPRLIEGYTSDGLQVEHTPVYARTRVLSAYAADTVRGLMVDVVEEGSGKQAKPYSGGAGGKTASAQTGQIVEGEEVVHAWFCGFFPAEQPEYVVVVLVEGGDSGSDTAAPVFKAIADGIAALDMEE